MITLLNGEPWGLDEILTQMYSDEFYYGHLGKHALSSSSLKLLLKSPKTYRNIMKYGSEDSAALATGKLTHWMLLEPNIIDKIHFVDASTKNTKIYKEAKEKHQEVFLEKEKQEAQRLTDAILRNEAALKLLNKAEFEVPMIKMLDGYAIRGKADILRDDTIVDYKTTASDLSTFRYSADKYGYDLQAYLYLRLFDKEKFTFLVIDKKSTDVGIFDTSEEFIERGRQKFIQAIDNYKYFFDSDTDIDQYVMRGVL